MRSGFVGIVGLPNVGKSSLLNALIGEKISITSAKAQTTRNHIMGIYNDCDSQIIFVDTPGITQAKSQLNTFMNKEAYNQIDGTDVVYYLFDITKRFSSKDHQILNHIFKFQTQVFLILTKIDLVSKSKLLENLNLLSNQYPFKEIIPISSLTNNNLDTLIKVTKQYLLGTTKYFDTITNVSYDFRVAEIVREKILNLFYQEIPHQLVTLVEEARHSEKRFFVRVLIIVGKNSHKSIIIGKNGDSLKRINFEASKDLKTMMNKKVFLSLHVKVDEAWFDNQYKLAQYGYNLKTQNE